jgi:hypothetical protein
VLYAYLKHIFSYAPEMATKREDWVTALPLENAPDSCTAGKK